MIPVANGVPPLLALSNRSRAQRRLLLIYLTLGCIAAAGLAPAEHRSGEPSAQTLSAVAAGGAQSSPASVRPDAAGTAPDSAPAEVAAAGLAADSASAQAAPTGRAPGSAPALARAGLQPLQGAASGALAPASPGDSLAANLLARGPEARALAPVARSGTLFSRQRAGDLTDLKAAGLALRRPPAGLAPEAKPEEKEDPGSGPGEDRPQVLTYVVQEGDTLWDIAVRFRTDTDTLVASNPDLDPDLLRPGQELTVLANATGLVYEVQPGDTLSGLAARYSVPEAEIVRVNGIQDPAHLPVGVRLILPGAKVPRAAAPRAAEPRSEGWIWPLRGPITSPFGPRWGEFHYGLDIGARAGTPVVAVRSGRVVQAGWNGSYGYSVLIDHGDGTQARYAHASRLLVEKGQWVRQGETILLVGSTGRSTGPHLHLEILVGGRPQNPLKFLP